jgi:hypothetical protein
VITKKGLKMSISKCFRTYEMEKSQSIVTEIRGQHDQTNGYIFEDDLENNRIILTWYDEELSFDEKLKKVKKLYELLDRHGFSDYIHFNKYKALIYLTNFS